ncbi:MAG: hypothetical protein QOH68_568 [Nocardioidaceae bacterium]|nr:hypothetical protein [Nocardioidaceae bacterium]
MATSLCRARASADHVEVLWPRALPPVGSAACCGVDWPFRQARLSPRVRRSGRSVEPSLDVASRPRPMTASAVPRCAASRPLAVRSARAERGTWMSGPVVFLVLPVTVCSSSSHDFGSTCRTMTFPSTSPSCVSPSLERQRSRHVRASAARSTGDGSKSAAGATTEHAGSGRQVPRAASGRPHCPAHSAGRGRWSAAGAACR